MLYRILGRSGCWAEAWDSHCLQSLWQRGNTAGMLWELARRDWWEPSWARPTGTRCRALAGQYSFLIITHSVHVYLHYCNLTFLKNIYVVKPPHVISEAAVWSSQAWHLFSEAGEPHYHFDPGYRSSNAKAYLQILALLRQRVSYCVPWPWASAWLPDMCG